MRRLLLNVGLLIGAGCSCSRVWTCVESLRMLKGPAMQLPVLRLSVLIPLVLEVCIESTTIGILA